MTEKRYTRMPPKFSELKKQAAEINDPIDKLNFWIDQERQYIQETSWTMKQVTVLDINDVYISDDLIRRSKEMERSGKDHNLRGIEAEIKSLKVQHELNLNDTKPKRKPPKPNETRKDMEKRGKENEPKRKQFISEAKAFLHEKISAGKSRSIYITDNDWPTAKFYKYPFRSSDIPESTRKYWIKKAISKGEI